MKKNFLLILLISAICNFTSSLYSQTSIPGGNVKGTWTLAGSPYNVQGAIQIVNGDSLIIQPGVTVSFQGTYKLLVLGKLKAIGTVADTIIFTAANITNGWRGIRFENTPTTNDSSIIKYCKLTYGKATGTSPDDKGGAFYIDSFSKIRISNSRISNCLANSSGGGICCISSSPLISNNTINTNTATAPSGDGGGIFTQYGNPIISNNNINSNTASGGSTTAGGIAISSGNAIISSNNINNNTGAGIGTGGSPIINNNTINNNTRSGIYCSGGSPVISNNTINNNTAPSGGGGINISNSGNCTISDNIINNNTASYGGGIKWQGSGTIKNNKITNNSATAAAGYGGGIYVVSSNPSNIFNNIISNNSATGINGGAGGIYCNTGSSNQLSLTNNTVSNNYASGTSGKGGALYFDAGSDPDFRNCIFYGNTAPIGSTVFINDEASDPNFYYSDVQGGTGAFALNGNFYTGAYSNNIDVNPLFVAPSGGAGTGFNGLTADWSLQNISPCIDTGDPNNSIGYYPATDKAGNPRVVVCDIDMGAYEYQSGLPFLVNMTQQNILCNGSFGNATANVSNGSPPYTYSWNNGQTAATSTGLLTGFYFVTVNDANGCSRSGTVTITAPAALTANMTYTATACNTNNGIAKVTAGGGNTPYTYLWSNGQTTSVATGLGTGTYTATVTEANGCTKTGTITVTLKSPPSVSFTTTPTGCTINTGSATANPSGGAAPYTFLWNDGQTTQTATGYGVGGHTVTVTDANGCSASSVANVTYNIAIAASFTKTNVLCFGGNTGSATVTVSNGTPPFNYSWSNGQTSQTATGLVAATYTVTSTDGQGCVLTSTTTITQPLILSANITSSSASCGMNDGSATASPLGGTFPYTYQWSTGQTAQTSTGMKDDLYSVLVTDANGCTFYNIATVGINPPPAVPICVVTVDSTSSKNVLVWDKPLNAGIDSFKVYRQISSIFTPIASIPYSALSTFTDSTTGVNPNITSYRYQLSVVDTCGNESAPSLLHRTIHLSVSPASPCGNNLFWNDYMGFPVFEYKILRDTTGNYNWQVLDSVSIGTNAWTDTSCSLPANTFYVIEVEVPAGGCTPSLKNPNPMATTVKGSKSNSDNKFTSGVNEYESRVKINISPNPSSGLFTIQSSSKISEIEIMNVLGEKVFAPALKGAGSISLQSEGLTIYLRDQPKGVYFYKVQGENGTGTGKIIIE